MVGLRSWNDWRKKKKGRGKEENRWLIQARVVKQSTHTHTYMAFKVTDPIDLYTFTLFLRKHIHIRIKLHLYILWAKLRIQSAFLESSFYLFFFFFFFISSWMILCILYVVTRETITRQRKSNKIWISKKKRKGRREDFRSLHLSLSWFHHFFFCTRYCFNCVILFLIFGKNVFFFFLPIIPFNNEKFIYKTT